MTVKEMTEYLKKMAAMYQKMVEDTKNNPNKNIDNIQFCLQAKSNIKKHGLDFKAAGYTW